MVMFVQVAFSWNYTIDSLVWSYVASTGYMKGTEQAVTDQASKVVHAKNYCSWSGQIQWKCDLLGFIAVNKWDANS
jgi:hypothetical protein